MNSQPLLAKEPDSPLDALLYDCEIINCIPGSKVTTAIPLTYCGGWDDHANMGIACVAAHDFVTGLTHVFMADNLHEFAELVSRREYIIGFYSSQFDDKLCAANGIEVKTTYDLCLEAKLAAGHNPNRHIRGYSLDALSESTLGKKKSGDGALAPQLWQQKRYGAVIDYCLRDVQLSVELFRRRNNLIDPLTGDTIILRSLFEAKHNGPQAGLF